MATHSSVLAWRIPGTEEPGGLPSMGSHRVGHDWSDLAAAAATAVGFHCGSTGKESTYNVGDLGSIPGLEDPLEKGKATHSSFLAWRIPGLYSPWGYKESDTTEWVSLHFTSLGLEWKLTFSNPGATAEFSKFVGILSAALSQHHLLGFEIAQLEFHHLY